VAIICRLLASEQPPEVYEGAYEFLRDARAVTLMWLRDLKTAFRTDSADGTTVERQHLVCEMAAICRMTYDVDPDHVPELLKTSEDVSVALECAMAVRESRPPKLSTAPLPLQLLISRDERLAHKLENYLRECILDDPAGFDDALLAVWSGYRSGPDIHLDDSSWVYTETAAHEYGAVQRVHYNTLEGTLLIDGRALGRLPADLMNHPTYTRTFGQVSCVVHFSTHTPLTRTPSSGSWTSYQRICPPWNMRLDFRSKDNRCACFARI
jgi:hypothetical protein